jgi:hypothetical protein
MSGGGSPRDLKRLMEMFYATPSPNPSSTPFVAAYYDFRNEVAGTSTQCTAWTTTMQGGQGTPSGSQGNVTSGPTVSLAAVSAQMGPAAGGVGSQPTLFAARDTAIRLLCDQLIAGLPSTLPGTVSVTSGSTSITFSAPQNIASGMVLAVVLPSGAVVFGTLSAGVAGTSGTLTSPYGGSTNAAAVAQVMLTSAAFGKTWPPTGNVALSGW